MNKKIIIFTVLLTNITFAYALPVEVRVTSEISETRKTSLVDMSVAALCERGLERDAAQDKVKNSLQHSEHITHIMAQNIVNNLEEIEQHDIITYISDAALFGKRVDLSSYESLIALVQKTKNSLLDQKSLEKLQQISLENQAIA